MNIAAPLLADDNDDAVAPVGDSLVRLSLRPDSLEYGSDGHTPVSHIATAYMPGSFGESDS